MTETALRPVVLTLRKPTGEFIRKQAAYPTSCPGVYRFPMPDECERCWLYEEHGYCDGSCGLPVEWSWCMACEAGVILSNFSYEKPTIAAITARLAETGFDFTLPLEQVVPAARSEAAQSVRDIVSWSLMATTDLAASAPDRAADVSSTTPPTRSDGEA